jgi:hypothetical protein
MSIELLKRNGGLEQINHEQLNLVVAWLDQYVNALHHYKDRFSPQAYQQMLYPLEPFMRNTVRQISSSSVPDGRSKVDLDGVIYNINTRRTFLGKLTYHLWPSGAEAPIQNKWGSELASRYSSRIRELAPMLIRGITIPPLFTIDVPQDGLSVDKNKEEITSWVSDFGPAIFCSSKGRDGLPGRTAGHVDHETFHRIVSLGYPETNVAVFETNPYLKESLAITAASLLYPIPQTVFLNSIENDNVVCPALPAGMEQSYLASLTEGEIVHPLTFQELNGGQLFQHHLYAQRMMLSAFISTLAFGTANDYEVTESIQINVQAESELFRQILNRGLQYVNGPAVNGPDKIIALEHIMNTIREVNNKRIEGVDVTDETFWQEFFRNVKSPILITRGLVERMYQKYAKIITPLFLTKQMPSGEYLPRWWDGFSDGIKAEVSRYCPSLHSMMKQTDHSKIKDYLRIEFPVYE